MLRRMNPIWVYIVISAGITLANTTIFTALAVYYIETVGMNPLQLVLVGTVLEGTILLCELPTGVVADTYSRRLSVIVGMFVLSAAYWLEGSLPFFLGILLAEAVRGVGETFLSGALDAWLADEVGEAQLGAAYLRASQISRVVGLFALGLSVVLASISVRLPIYAAASVYLLLGVFLVLAMTERGFTPQPATNRNPLHAMRATLRDGTMVVRGRPLLIALLVISVFGGAASEGFDRLNEAHLLQTIGLPSLGTRSPVAWFALIAALGELLGFLFVGGLQRRLETLSQDSRRTAQTLFYLHGASLLATLLFALAGNLLLAIMALLLRAVLGALAGPLLSTWTAQQIDPQVRATVLSLRSLSDATGQTLGGPGVGAIGLRSLRAALVAAALLMLPALPLFARAARNPAKAPAAVAE
jgi:DHA3 family tetracycline resistance protein-like MFS transporter